MEKDVVAKREIPCQMIRTLVHCNAKPGGRSVLMVERVERFVYQA
jgi:hypothetical protein